MSYKPDELTLVAYLYDELKAEERAKVATYLESHPETRKELDEIKSMRKFMGKLGDKEVVEPSFVFDKSNVVVVNTAIWRTGFFRATIGIAASIVLLMVAGYLTNFSITKNEEGVKLSFGQTMAQPVEKTGLSEEDIQAMMNKSFDNNNQALLAKMAELENSISNDLVSYKKSNEQAIASLRNKGIDEALMQAYVSKLTEENKSLVVNMMALSETAQKQYINELLADFSLYLEERRQNDLEIIQASFNNLKDNTQVNQLETNQILAGLITTVNNQNN